MTLHDVFFATLKNHTFASDLVCLQFPQFFCLILQRKLAATTPIIMLFPIHLTANLLAMRMRRQSPAAATFATTEAKGQTCSAKIYSLIKIQI